VLGENPTEEAVQRRYGGGGHQPKKALNGRTERGGAATGFLAFDEEGQRRAVRIIPEKRRGVELHLSCHAKQTPILPGGAQRVRVGCTCKSMGFGI